MFASEKDAEKARGEPADNNCDMEENSGFAIVINGHSLVYCLTSELEHRYNFVNGFLCDTNINI